MEVLITFLIVISGICWSAVYVDCIRIGFKQKTYCMPLFALGLNIAWEGLYAFTDLFVRENIDAQALANTLQSFALGLTHTVYFSEIGVDSYYIYPFLDFDKYGVRVFLYIAILTVFFLLLGYLWYLSEAHWEKQKIF